MRDDHRMVGDFPREIDEPGRHVVIVLAIGRPERPIGLVPLPRREGRMLAGDLGVQPALEVAEGDFDEPAIEDHWRQLDLEGGAHALHGLGGAAERRGKPFQPGRIDPIAFEQVAQQHAVGVRLQLAGAVERDVPAALITLLAVPVRLAMAGEVEVGPRDRSGHGRRPPHPFLRAAADLEPAVMPRSSLAGIRVPLVAHRGAGGQAHLLPHPDPFPVAPMTFSPAQIVAALNERLGSAAVIAEPDRMGAFLNEPRKRFHTSAAAVVTPGDVGAVQALLGWAHENGVGIIPQGGNTGLVGAQVPLTGHEVIVSLRKLDRIRSIDAGAGVMVAEAGVILEQAHRAAEAEGAMFPLWLASQGSARIGGVLSSNAGGVNVLAYGNARELTLGVEAVLADGRLYRGLNALKKDNTGYDLKDLLVGAEGTLGVITAASLKLYPLPEDYETALVNVASPEIALTLFQLLRDRAGGRLNAFELIPRIGLDIQLRHGMLDADPTASASPWYALIELSRMAGTAPGLLQASLEAALERGLVSDAALAESLADRTRMWAFREQMSECQSREGASVKHDVSVPIAAVPALIAEGTAAAERLVPGIRPVPFGHMGDGNIHFNFSMPVGADPKAFMDRYDEALHEVIYEVVLRHGGSVSAEHGIGQLKVELLQRVKDPVALDMMRAIKAALDPKGILNPGKLLGMRAD